jgi:hypothetical protein
MRDLLRFESSCRAILPRYNAIARVLDRANIS